MTTGTFLVFSTPSNVIVIPTFICTSPTYYDHNLHSLQGVQSQCQPYKIGSSQTHRRNVTACTCGATAVDCEWPRRRIPSFFSQSHHKIAYKSGLSLQVDTPKPHPLDSLTALVRLLWVTSMTRKKDPTIHTYHDPGLDRAPHKLVTYI
jgi:hypothetical protein